MPVVTEGLASRIATAAAVVDQLEFAEQRRAGGSGGIEISAGRAVAGLNQLLAHAQGLEVHAEDGGNLGLSSGEMVPSVDLVEDGIDLQAVVALDVQEAIGPGCQVGARVEDRGAGETGESGNAGKADHGGVDFRRIEVIERTRSDAGGDGGVGRVLVGPGCISTGGMNDAEDGVGADELPRPHRFASLSRVAIQFLRVDGADATVGEGSPGRSPVYLGLVDVDAFFIFGCKAGWRRTRGAGPRSISIACNYGWSVEGAGIGDVVIDAGQGGASASDDRGQARK